MEEKIELENSRKLYGLIATAGTESTEVIRGAKVTMKKVTDALRKVLWGMEMLEKLDKRLRSAFSVIRDATRQVETNLSKRRKFWDQDLEEFEQEIVWAAYKSSLARLEDCQDRIGDITHNTSGVKDNLIFLSNMASTQAILATTQATLDAAKDSSSMRIIAILTAIFLLFTFVAVFLTTPMFKFADPPTGQLFSTVPFVIYWGASAILSVIRGAAMGSIALPYKKKKPGDGQYTSNPTKNGHESV